MSISGKRPLLTSALAMVCIIIYAVSLILGAGRILVNSNRRGILAEKEFNDILDSASSAAILGFTSRSYQEVIQDAIMESETILGIIISGSNGEFGFERQYGSVINWVGNSPRFRTGFGIAKNPYFQAIRIEGQRNTTVQAIYSTLDYDFLIRVLRDTLIIILVVVALAIITLVVENKLKVKSVPFVLPASEPETRPQGSPWKEHSYPKGLYSPRGIGWESYTKERLESELHRCAASEEDLIFIVMENRGAKFGEESYRKLAAEGVNFFTERDLVFERGKQGLSLIIPTLSFEKGFMKCEKFRKHIRSTLTDASGAPPDLCIGLSSRAGRLVEAERVMLEASEALAKALKEKNPQNPIVAFKSDPKKYREFINRIENSY